MATFRFDLKALGPETGQFVLSQIGGRDEIFSHFVTIQRGGILRPLAGILKHEILRMTV